MPVETANFRTGRSECRTPWHEGGARQAGRCCCKEWSEPLCVLRCEASQQLRGELLRVAGQDAAGQIKDASHEFLRAVPCVSAVIVEQAFRAGRRQLVQHPDGIEQELGDCVVSTSAGEMVS